MTYNEIVHEADAGMVLLSAVFFLGALVLLTSTAFFVATTEMKISHNYTVGEQGYFRAWAGCEEARARLRHGSPHAIVDAFPEEATWRVLIGSVAAATAMGFDRKNHLHDRFDSLVPDMGYTVEVRHQTDKKGRILLWGDANGDGAKEKNTSIGDNIYLITSRYSHDGLERRIQIEVTRPCVFSAPGVLYAAKRVAVHGRHIFVSGTDRCGRDDVPGISSAQKAGAVTVVGGPEVIGAGGRNPDIMYGKKELDLHSMIDDLKKHADYSYLFRSKRQDADDRPGPGDGWCMAKPGVVETDPQSYGDRPIIHFNTEGTYIQFQKGVTGFGVLLVEGDLIISGDFGWYGPILVTGSVLFTGGGEKQITGAVMAGDTAVMTGATGHTRVAYCSKAMDVLTKKRPLPLLSWKDVF